MAVPGIIVAIFISASMAMGIKHFGIGFGNWDWYVSLMFGSVICATDPVAVVALLKELGGGKKLRTLIESESLLNDGTAIVVFMIFYSAISSQIGGSNNPEIIGSAIDFIKVAFGGVAIGAVIGFLTLSLFKTVFNDSLFEITAIIGSAYLTFFIAESFHLSGVIGLVTLGLIMAGRGKTRISPEVGHFLHDFWVLAAFIANTLIFIVVGVIIAHRTRFEMEDFIDLAIVYVGIHLIRGFIIFILFPLMKKIGYGVSVKDSVVLWWGGLRGVIGLAMALIVAETSSIPHDIRDQFLFITAGIVLLTSLINATTIKALVKGLGLTKVPLAKATLVNHTIDKLRHSAELRLELMRKDRFMGGADWSHVEKFLPTPWSPSKDETLDQVENGLIKELRINLLNKEKSSYWKLFSKGLLGRPAYNLLMKINNELLDQGGEFSIASSTNIDLLWGSSKIFNEVQDWKILRKSSNNDLFSQLYTNYDAVRAMIKSQDDLIVLVKNLQSDTTNTQDQIDVLKSLMEEVNEKKIQGLTFLRNLKNAFPEVYKTIETRQASRDLLNFQKTELSSMINLGRVDKDDSEKFLLEIEMKMSDLLTNPPIFKLPKSQELLKLIPWIEKLDNSSVMNLSKIIEIKIFPANYSFDKELESKSIGVLVRGNAKIIDNDQSNDLEIGFIISKRNKRITSESKVISNSPLTLVWVSEDKYKFFQEFVKDFDDQLG
jgi:NhaP-type Na+/H+ or K+/H+ antiporter